MTHGTVGLAVRRAKAAFDASRRADDVTRAGWLRAAADALDAEADDLVAIADSETALGQPRLRGELARTTAQLRMFAAVIVEGAYLEAVVDHADPTAVPPRPDLRRLLVPLGPVAVYAASNFPFAFSVAGGDTAAALALGCPVVVKAHPGHPVLSRRTAGVVQAALASVGAPHGMLALVEGFEAGIELVDHPDITAAAFTGSVAGGRALFDRAAARPVPIPFYGELGSINPVVVTPGADAARGAELAAGLAGSFQLGAGQFCTKPGVVLAPRGSQLEVTLSAHLGGAAPMLNDAIAQRYAQGAAALAGADGVEVIAGAPDPGSPLILAVDAALVSDDVLTEVFGPVTVLIRYGDLDEALAVLARIDGSLTTTIHSQDAEDISGLVDTAVGRSGRVLFAGWPTGVAVTWAQQHGGPYPATTSVHTSVGATSLRRFQRPVAFQDAPQSVLPDVLRDHPARRVPRRVDGQLVL